MKATKRKINDNNFSLFARLINEVHKIALGKPLTKISEGTGDDIAIKISIVTGVKISGKTLWKYSDAALKKDWAMINPQLPNLHCLAEYVMKSRNPASNKEIKDYPYWFDYENQLADDQFIVEKNTHKNTQLPDDRKNPETVTQRENNLKENEQNETNQTFFKKDAELKTINTHALTQPLKPKVKRLTIIFTLLLFFILVFVGYLIFHNLIFNQNFAFTQSFETTSEDSLLSKGWFLLDKDSEYWNKRSLREKSLTLYTLVGDYWIRNRDSSKRLIKNNFVYRLPNRLSNFEAEVEIDDFFPNKCCQQAGFIFLKDTSDLANNFRYTITKNSNDSIDPIHIDFVYSETNGIRNKIGVTGNLVQNQDDYIIGNPFKNDSTQGIKKIWLNVIKQGSQLTFRAKIYRDDRDYKVTQTYTTVYEPRFICLAAFQAFPHEFNNYKASPVIPASFKNFTIRSLNSNQ